MGGGFDGVQVSQPGHTQGVHEGVYEKEKAQGEVTERVLGPAIHWRGRIYTLPAPSSHDDIETRFGLRKKGGRRGFYTDMRSFIGREEGAALRGQKEPLHSEDL